MASNDCETVGLEPISVFENTDKVYKLLGYSMALHLACKAIRALPRTQENPRDGLPSLCNSLEPIPKLIQGCIDGDSFRLNDSLYETVVDSLPHAWKYGWKNYGLETVANQDSYGAFRLCMEDFHNLRTANMVFMLLLCSSRTASAQDQHPPHQIIETAESALAKLIQHLLNVPWFTHSAPDVTAIHFEDWDGSDYSTVRSLIQHETVCDFLFPGENLTSKNIMDPCPGSFQWVFNDANCSPFTTWAKACDPNHRACWIVSLFGTGKSVLLKHIVKQVQRDSHLLQGVEEQDRSNPVVISHFFSYLEVPSLDLCH
ncbi:hypothetical protein B0T20DRAFT_103886 [Sordaria brevicollis]|uniref:Nephrocystin 3-like N-terminal domain-containing protein n=1 Tax=Sordaria brevicollis TaxID=83679 RepID=A0AAE0U2L0_SORBR|nr:hypothetical protein B0T20DRAFT_103886 [Sordaria brevicollis]